MFSKLKLIAQILLYTLIVGIGCRVFYSPLRIPLPFPEEAPHILTVAAEAEKLDLSALPPESQAVKLPFHQSASLFVKFISEPHVSGYRIRAYRLFSATLSILFLLLLPALGLKRRGGCFETEDTPFWIALFVITTPPFLCYGSLFLPLSFQALLFLSLLVAFRSYVQWPGYLSVIFISIFIGLSISIDAEMAWVTLLMLPAIALGVGWRRIRLYWHNGHFFLLSGLLTTYLLCGFYFHVIPTPTMPTFVPLFGAFYAASSWRFIWLTAGGFGLVAWLGLLFWSFRHPDHRWTKVFVTMFPIFFLASFVFGKDGGIAVATICLSLLLLGMALAILPLLRIRILIGGSAILALALGMPRFIENHFNQQFASEPQRSIARTLMRTCRTSKTWEKVAISIQDPLLCARFVWPIRHSHFLPVAQAQKADVYLTDIPPAPGLLQNTLILRLPQEDDLYLIRQTPPQVN